MIWFKRFIKRIQNSDEKIKRQWMILFSIATIMVIVAFWIFFTFRQESFSRVEISQVDEPGFWQISKNGTSVIFDSITDNIKSIFSLITKKNIIVIE